MGLDRNYQHDVERGQTPTPRRLTGDLCPKRRASAQPSQSEATFHHFGRAGGGKTSSCRCSEAIIRAIPSSRWPIWLPIWGMSDDMVFCALEGLS
jgi:hypothetical protein